MAYTIVQFITNVENGQAIKVRQILTDEDNPQGIAINIGSGNLTVKRDWKDLGKFYSTEQICCSFDLRTAIVNAEIEADEGTVEPGGSIRIEANGGSAVNVQDQTSEPIDTYFAKFISNFSIALDTVASGVTVVSLSYAIEAVPGHNISINDEILLLDVVGERVFLCKVLDVVTNTITVDRPIDHTFPATATLGRIVTTNMAVDGSSDPQIFSTRAGATPTDYTRFMMTIISNTIMDDGKFGSLAALTRGLVFRVVNSFQKTIFNFKTNGDISQFCYDIRYSDKAPAGSYGFNARISFGGQDKHGVVLRIQNSDVLQWVIQDDLRDLDSLRISAQGHFVID